LDVTEDEIKVKKLEEEDLDQQRTALTNTLSVLESDIEKLKADVSAMEVALKEAGETRKAENEAYAAAISDQRATVEILKKALARLQAFYGGAQLVQARARNRQEPGARAPPPPPKPADYRKSAAAGGVVQLMMEIIKDAEVSEIEIQKGEQSSQNAYAMMVKDTTASINSDRSAIAEKEAAVASAEGEKSETEASQLQNTESLRSLGELLQAHHTECDWLLKYFDVRQQARAEEMSAIEDAKAILSGADFGGV